MGSSSGEGERIIYYAYWDTCAVVSGKACWVLATITPEAAYVTKAGERTGPVVPGVAIEVLKGFRLRHFANEAARRAAVRRTGIPTAAWEYRDGEVVSSGEALHLRARGDGAANTYGTTHGQGWWTVYERPRIQWEQA